MALARRRPRGVVGDTACGPGTVGGACLARSDARTSGPAPAPTAEPGAVESAAPTATSIPNAGAGPTAESSLPATSRVLDVEPPRGLPDIDVSRYRQLLARDVIRPIYDPVFVPASEADTSPNELVMGVVVNGEAKAYPITPLIRREMVNDELGGVPILVTW